MAQGGCIRVAAQTSRDRPLAGLLGPILRCGPQGLRDRPSAAEGGGHTFSAQELASPPINKCVYWVWFVADEKAPKVLQVIKNQPYGRSSIGEKFLFPGAAPLAPEQRPGGCCR